MLTHHTLVTAVASLQGFVDLGNIRMGPGDSFLSFLTLAHIFDRVVEEFMLSVGGHIGYWQVGAGCTNLQCADMQHVACRIEYNTLHTSLSRTPWEGRKKRWSLFLVCVC